MNRPAQPFKSVITLVPKSGIQFLDFGFTLSGETRVNRAFLEEEDAPGEGARLKILAGERGELLHPETQQPVEATYSINLLKAIEPFLDAWVPVPFMRVLGRDANGHDVYDQGPSNWARVHLTSANPGDEEADPTYKLALAFDTELDEKDREADRPYLMPNVEDARGEESFGFSAQTDDVAWFVGEAWLDQWIEEMFHDLVRRRNPRGRFRPENLPYAFEHTARYLTFLTALDQLCMFPKIRLVDSISPNRSYAPIKVDLVIDVGNSRTCGILIESYPDNNDHLDLANSSPFSLRDLSKPTEVHRLPFESRVEFSRPSFGRDGVSRLSGRANAFSWPSLVRVGPEAVRLSVGASGTEGATGMSSPKRYLWDHRPLNQVWRFRGADPNGTLEPQVSGPLLAFVTESGDVVRQLKPGAPSAIRPKFSRSSLFTFLMTEVVLQAVTGINSAESRGRQRYSDIPRELRQIIMTVPPATPLAEQRIMKERVEGAVKLAWQALGWTDARHVVPPPEPVVQIAFDEATCTQIVYLYSEITQKLQSPAADLFEILGKVRPSVNEKGPSLRIASIDIGGGTTDLMVITYTTMARQAIVPTQLFREGFKIAGDDILEAVVARHVLPAIEAHIEAQGASSVRDVLRGIVGPDWGGQSEQQRQFRRRFVTQVCVPAALALLRMCELSKQTAEEAASTHTLATLFQGTPPADTIAELETLMSEGSAAGWTLLEAPVVFDAKKIASTVRAVMAPVLSDLCEVVHSFDCDALLLSGRPSRLPVVLDLILSRMPTRPDRIIPMHQYKVGPWYPFRDRGDRIDDPKTTVAVGALLCNLAEAQIEGFVLAKSKLQMKSTARFIGVMQRSGTIRNDELLFSNVDLDGKKRKDENASALSAFLPTTIGFRQLPLERWPATPLYVLEYANPGTAGRLKLPLKVMIERSDAGDDEDVDEAKREDFRVSEVEDAERTTLRSSDVVMRLQTLKSLSGYWLDTGVVDSY